MEDTPGVSKMMVLTSEQAAEQVALAKKILNELNINNLQGLILTVAVTPKVEELTPEQIAEIEAEGLKPGDASKISHVLVGPIPVLVHLFRATGSCLYETYKLSKQGEDGVLSPEQVLH